MASVFVSHASRDGVRVADTLSLLRGRGLVNGTEIVTDQGLEPGLSIRDSVRKAIQDAASIVVLWSDAAAQSANVNYEIGMADALEKPILIVNLDGLHSIPPGLANAQVVDLHPAT